MATMLAREVPGRPLLAVAFRRTLLVVGALLVLAGISTFVLADRTADYFAWTIEPPLTAAFMGAGYWGTIALVVAAARARDWAHARIAIPSTIVFSAFVLVATWLHFDRFHDDRPITWAWIAVYVGVPCLLGVLGVRAARSAGPDPPRAAPMQRWGRALVLVQAAVLLSVGVALFAAPDTGDALWPWSLTPLTARIVGAFLIGLAFGALHSFLEADWERVLPAATTAAVFGALQLVNLVRYSGTPEWASASAWVYVAFAVFMLAFGVESVRRGIGRRNTSYASR